MKRINGNRIKFYFVGKNPFSINAITKTVQTNKCVGVDGKREQRRAKHNAKWRKKNDFHHK